MGTHTLHPKNPCPRREMTDLLMKNFYLGVEILKELIKLVTRALKTSFFEINAILGPLEHTHVL